MGVVGGWGWVRRARVQAQRTGRSRRSVAAPRETAGRASGVVRPVRQSNRVGEAEAVALHRGHPGGSGKSPSTKGFPHGPVLRGRQSKDILFWCGSSSGCRLRRRRCRVQGAGWMQGAGCGVRAGCVRCGQGGHRQRPGDGCAISLQEISIVRQKKESSVGRAVRGCGSGARCEGGARAVRWVRPLSRQGISTACPLGTDLGMSGSSSASKGGQGGGRGQAALGGADFSERATARAARACAAEGAVPRPPLACSGGGWVDRRA